MALIEQELRYRSMDNWFKTPQGTHIADAITAEFANFNDKLNGLSLLQLGSLGTNSWLAQMHYRHKWIASPISDAPDGELKTSLTSIPIERDSIDCIVAPFMMELFSFDKNPLDEIDRILKPMGYVIFLGINPISFWGAVLKLGGLPGSKINNIHLVSSFAIKRAMINRGYQHCNHSSFYYIPPVRTPSMIRKLEFLNEMGKMVWPFPAGFYCLVLQKFQIASPNYLVIDERDERYFLPAKGSLNINI